jgi:hypothetical protein
LNSENEGLLFNLQLLIRKAVRVFPHGLHTTKKTVGPKGRLPTVFD